MSRAALPLVLLFSGCTLLAGVTGDHELCSSPASFCAALGCVDLATDTGNCGACGHACAAGQACSGGTCACTGSACGCPAGAVSCGGGCAVIATDPRNCGACGQACAAGQACLSGACCASASACGGKCVDLQQDPKNCGKCGLTCPAGDACVKGGCATCGAGQTACPGGCLSTASDPANCGACGRACDGGGQCSQGLCAPTKLYALNDGVGAITVKDSTLYWVGNGLSGGMMVGRLDLETLVPEKLANALNARATISFDGVGKVYWIEWPKPSPKCAVAHSVDTTTFAVTDFPTVACAGDQIVADGSDVYWSDTLGATYRLSASTPTAVPTQIASATLVGSGSGLAIDATSVYILGTTNGQIFSVPLLGQTAKPIVSALDPVAMAIDALYLYYIDATIIRRAPLAGGAPVTVVSASPHMPTALAVDATSVYWLEPNSGFLKKAALDGSSGPTTLAAGLNFPDDVALGAGHVYFVDNATLFRVPK